MSATVIDTVSTQLEIVAPELARYYDLSTSLASALKISKTVAASRYLYRQPLMQWVGGTFQKYSANGGDMGGGSGPKTSKLESGYFDSNLGFEITKEQMDYMKSNGSAMMDVMTEIMSNAFQQLDVIDNVYLFGDGTGKLTNPASTGTSTTLTFAAPTDMIGINQLDEGQFVDVWDSTGATKRAGGPYQVTNIEYSTNTVTFGAAVTGIQTTDLLAVVGADAYGPSTLTSFSSTWPGGGLTNGPGLTGDSWRHGLRYANDATPANYYLGVQKSTLSKLLPVQIAAGSTALTFATVELAKDLLLQRRDKSILTGMQCVIHYAQRYQLQQIVTAMQTFYRESKTAAMIDVQPVAEDTVTVAGINCIADKRQSKDRVDAFNSKNWYRVEGHPSQWLDFGEGQKVRLRTAPTTGNPQATYELKIVQKMDTGCSDPGASFYIDGLAVPTGF